MFNRFWKYYEKNGRKLAFGILALGFGIAALYEAFFGFGRWAIYWILISVALAALSITEKSEEHDQTTDDPNRL